MPRSLRAVALLAVLVAGCGGAGSTAVTGARTTTTSASAGTTATPGSAPGGTGGVPATGGGGGPTTVSGGPGPGRVGGVTGGSTGGSTTPGGTGPDGGATTASPTGSSVGGPTTTPAQQQNLDAQLAEAVRITPFDGFAEQPPPGNGLGALDLERASGGDASERDALTTAGFQRGYARGWTSNGEDITTVAYQLGSADQANAYLQDTINQSIKGNGSATFDAGVPGATGYREQGTDPSGQQYIAWGAVFVRGSRFYEQILRGPREGNTRSEADARDLCQRQAQRVGG